MAGLFCSVRGNHVLDDRLSVQISGPVDQVEAAEEYRKDDAGHAVDLAYAVEGLLALFSHGLSFSRLCRCALGDGGKGRVFTHLRGVVCHSNSIRVVLLHNRALFFLWACHSVNTHTLTQ